ncbi:MAG: hypothetical protein JNL82_04475 [Myxococcales bacterium]|nr:hypothetical protein [Myxococcales bacterium]
MTTALLTPMTIQALARAAVEASLHRDSLLAALPNELVGKLSRADNPLAQLFNDLHSLNKIPRLADGSVPLRAWLEAAAFLSGPLPQAAIFNQALDELSRHQPAAPVPVAPDTRAGERALVKLFHVMFTSDDVRRLLRDLPGGAELEAALPGPNASLTAVIEAAIDELARRDALDEPLFAALVRARPLREREILHVYQQFKP